MRLRYRRVLDGLTADDVSTYSHYTAFYFTILQIINVGLYRDKYAGPRIRRAKLTTRGCTDCRGTGV